MVLLGNLGRHAKPLGHKKFMEHKGKGPFVDGIRIRSETEEGSAHLLYLHFGRPRLLKQLWSMALSSSKVAEDPRGVSFLHAQGWYSGTIIKLRHSLCQSGQARVHTLDSGSGWGTRDRSSHNSRHVYLAVKLPGCDTSI